MTLTDTAYLEIDDGTGTTATFELHIGLEDVVDGQKSYIMAERGQYIQEIADNSVTDLGVDALADRRAGYWIDGGAGLIERTLQFETGQEDVRWGDGTGGTGAANVTTTDASGAGVDAIDRRDVMAYWLRRTRTDSFGQARLHWGQWTDGTISGISGVSAAEQGQPIPVAIASWNLPSPDISEDVVSFSGRIDLRRVALFPQDEADFPDWVSDAANKVADLVDGIFER